ncbi:MAG: phage tail tape measure protein [Paludibacter sp.]|nr:phage tail tape measure protein [Paludibacter sp.]
MADKIAKRGISIFIDGKEVSNSVKGIRSEITKMINEQNKMTIGSKEYVAQSRKIGQLKSYLTEHNELQKKISSGYGTMNKSSGSFFSRMANGFNKYFAMSTAFIASITGASLVFRKLSEDVAKMDDTYSDVMKTTGMTREEVIALNEELKKIDTRTSREQLNMLARDAGKLGISAKKDILDFVEAGNMINVALGEDLGDDAIKSIGKMVDIYKSSTNQIRDLNLKEQMLAVGSAINELGASSTASEAYLVEFAGRLGGVSKQAKISMADILGFAASLDQDMQAVEMSATALQNFIMKLMGDPAKFARLAGLEVGKFTELLKNDTNKAIKDVLRSLNEQGGFQQLIPVFQEMGLDGARAVGVLSSMAGSINKIDEAQKIANQSMSEGTSIFNEYSIKNNNMKAELDKARKAFQETALQLGESLNPILLQSTKSTTYLIKALVELPKWLRENKGMLIALVSVLTIYTIAVNKARIETLLHVALEKTKIIVQRAGIVSTLAAAAAQALFTGNLSRAAAAMRLLNAQMMINPYVALGVAIAAITIGIFKLTTRTTDAKKAMVDFNVELLKEQRELKNIFDAYKKANEGTDLKSKLLKTIKEKYGPYIKDLIDEKGKITDIEKAQKLANDALRDQISLKIRNQYIDEYTSKEIKQQAETLTKIRDRIQQSKGDTVADLIIGEIGNSMNENINDPMIKGLDSMKKILSDYGLMNGVIDRKEFNSLANSLASSYYRINLKTNEFKSIFKALVKDVGLVAKAVDEEEEDDDDDPTSTTIKYIEAEKALEKTSKIRQLVLLQMYEKMQITEELYNKLSEAETILALDEKLKLQKKYGEDTIDTELAIQHAMSKLSKEDLKRIEEHNKLRDSMTIKESFDTGEEDPIIDAERHTTSLRLKILEAFHQKGQISEREYVEGIAEIYKKNQQEINKYIRDFRLKSNQDDYDKAIIGRKTYLEKVKQITREYWEDTFADAQDVAESILAVANAAAEVVSNIVEAESLAIDAKYAKQLKAARKAGEDTTEIEEAIEAEKLEIRKKYVDLEFGIKAASIIADTAMAIMKMWAEGGPVAGPILAVLAGAAGVAQLAVANQQRNQVKNLWTGGYTDPGDKYDPRGIVHAGEFVASQESVNNPHIRPVLDAIDMAQRQGMASNVTPEYLSKALQASRHYAEGGFVIMQQPESVNTYDSNSNNDQVAVELIRVIARLNAKLDEGIEAYSVVSGPNGSSEVSRKYENMIKNVSR